MSLNKSLMCLKYYLTNLHRNLHKLDHPRFTDGWIRTRENNNLVIFVQLLKWQGQNSDHTPCELHWYPPLCPWDMGLRFRNLPCFRWSWVLLMTMTLQSSHFLFHVYVCACIRRSEGHCMSRVPGIKLRLSDLVAVPLPILPSFSLLRGLPLLHMCDHERVTSWEVLCGKIIGKGSGSWLPGLNSSSSISQQHWALS